MTGPGPYELGEAGGYVAAFTVELLYDAALVRYPGMAAFDFLGAAVRCQHCSEWVTQAYNEDDLWDELAVHAARHAPRRAVESTRPL